ncbi:MAG: M56 family metallopeptidase [Clostridiaceae bacterium]|nr:M56 family metallopeptidase [Clostridiaceae bacterium]
MEELFLRILNMSITATYVLIAVIVLRLILKRTPKWISYALWSLVLFRLVCPVSISSAFSIFGRLGKTASTGRGIEYIPANIGMMAAPQVDVGTTSMNTVINNALPAATPAASANPMQILVFIGACIWLAGFISMLIYSLVSYVSLKHRMMDATLLSGNIFETDRISSPFVCGLVRPRIYLPVDLAGNERDYVLRHEQTHISRRDYIIKPLAFLVLSVHWFNPFMWLAFILMSRDLEMSCDEKVISGLDSEGKAGYSSALMRLAMKQPILAGSTLAFGESGAKGRIKNVLNYKKPAFRILAVAVVIIAAAGFALLTNPIATDMPVTPAKGTGPFVGYVKGAATETFDVYTEEDGRYIMSLPWSLFDQFPGSDRTDPNWQPGWMNVDVYCASIDDFTWAVVCTGPSAGSGNANVCTSMDGGKTWWVGDKFAMYPGTVTGAGFASSEVGFMSYRYYTDQGPEISRTINGGKTWERMTVDIPDYLKEYKMTPLVPVFTGKSGRYPIDLYDSDANFTSTVYLTTEDGGMTWQWEKNTIISPSTSKG